jgi:hypothetical protein
LWRDAQGANRTNHSSSSRLRANRVVGRNPTRKVYLADLAVVPLLIID